MPAVFINYRTYEGQSVAALLEEALTHRFGTHTAFYASTSIKPGQSYPQALLSGVRRSSVLLAVVGGDWLDVRDARTGQRALDNRNDWVRKEILEAFRADVPVVPVLVGRNTERLDPARLPRALARLADVQSLRLDLHQKTRDLSYIGDELAEMVPELTPVQATNTEPADAQPGPVHNNSSYSNGGQSTQARDIHGRVSGTVINNATGPVHTGDAPQHVHQQQFHGDGASFVAGDHHGDVRQQFGSSSKRRSEDDE